MRKLRNFLFNTLISETIDTPTRKIFDFFLIILIVANVIALILETVPSINANYHEFFTWFELISVVIFSLEYVFRLYACVEDKRYHNSIKGRIRFALTPMQLIDALAIIPFYLSFLGIDARILRALRIMRIFRLLKLAKYVASLELITKVIKERASDLIISLTMVFILILISASLMYFSERDMQPEAFSSIPAAMGWAVATLTTVGYGDIYPITFLGKFLASCISILGIAAFAILTGILSSAFSDALKNK